MVVAVESNIKAKYSIHSLFDADKTIRREQIKDGSINTRPDWLRIYSYSRISKTTIETGPAGFNRNSLVCVRSEQK
jgi:hypothetical protein